MRVMSTHLPFDTSQLRWTASMVHGLHDRLTMMVPLLLAVEDRLTRCAKSIPKAWRRGPRCWTISPPGCRPAATPIGPRRATARALAQLKPELPANAGWSAILRLNLRSAWMR
jgi:hypothetical protein